eukprot:5066444-Pleurochrysis_carterae.AAC.1
MAFPSGQVVAHSCPFDQTVKRINEINLRSLSEDEMVRGRMFGSLLSRAVENCLVSITASHAVYWKGRACSLWSLKVELTNV